MKVSLLTLVAAVAALVCADEAPSQWQQCRSVPIVPGPVDTEICVTLEFTDCDMIINLTARQHIVVEAHTGPASLPLLDQTISNADIENPGLSWCKELAGNCDACISFTDVHVDSYEVGSGCVSVTSTCTHQTVEIGCFEDIPRIDVCSRPCPNDCSSHGTCTFEGICECEDGWEGDDCAIGCVEDKDGTELPMGDLHTLTTDHHGVLEGFVEVVSGRSSVNAEINIGEDSQYEFRFKRGCKPTDIDTDVTYELDGTVQESWLLAVTASCPENRGTVYFTAHCLHHAPCDFEMKFTQNHIIPLELNVLHKQTVPTLTMQYFTFTLDSSEVTIQIRSSSSILSASAAPGTCDSFLAVSAAGVRFEDEGYEYTTLLTMRERKADKGPWFVRVDPHSVEATFDLVVTPYTCQSCFHGQCGAHGCECESEEYSGAGCTRVSERFLYYSSTTTGSKGSDGGTEQWVYYAIFGALGVFALFVIMAVLVFAVLQLRKRIRKPPATLYSMLAEDGDDFLQ